MEVFLGVLAAGFSGSGDFFGGVASRRSDVTSVVLGTHLIGIIAVFVVAPFVGGALDAETISWGAAAGVSGAVGVLGLYQGFARSGIGIVSPIAAVGAAGWPVVWSVGRGDSITALEVVGLAAGIIAIWLIARSPGDEAGSPRVGVIFGLLAGLGFGGLLILLSFTADGSGIWALLPARASGAAVVAGFGALVGATLRPESAAFAPVAASGALTVLGNGAFILASDLGSLAVVSVLAAMFPAATVILARLVLKERLSRARLIGLIAALIAVGLVAVG
jgi:uncharacterized membrane protein